MARTWTRGAVIALWVVLVGCGGGGGGGGGDAGGGIPVTWTPASITVDMKEGEAKSVQLTAKLGSIPTDNVVGAKLVDDSGAFATTAFTATSSDGGYTWTGTVPLKDGLSAATHAGTLTLHLQTSSSEVALSGATVHYTVNVAVNPCLAWKVFASGDYQVENNIFGINGVTYTQCVGIAASDAVDASWTFDVAASDGGTPRTYPDVQFGRNPYQGSSATTSAPKKVGDVGSLVVHLAPTNTGFSSTMKGDLELDVYFVPSLTIDPNLGHMPMDGLLIVGPEVYGGKTWGSGSKTVTIAGCDWNVWVVHDKPTVGYFAAKPCNYPADFDLMPFINDMRVNQLPGGGYPANQIPDTDYITSVQVGTQVLQGSGSVKLQNFKVTIGPKS